jgi:hypothetical protein
MANTNVKWNISGSGAITTLLSTTMNSLTNTSFITSSVEVANRTDLLQYGQFELNLASANFPANGYANVWIINNVGTGYETVTSAGLPRAADTAMPTNTLNGAQVLASPVILLPPNNFKVGLQSQAGVTLASSGNTLKLIRFCDSGQPE